jgi:hypothetical protein
MNNEQGFEPLIPEEFSDQGHHSAVWLEGIARAQYLEANAAFEPGSFGEREYGQPPKTDPAVR